MVAPPCVVCAGDAPGRSEDYTAPFLRPIYPERPILDLDVLLSGGEAPSSGLPGPLALGQGWRSHFLTAHSSSPKRPHWIPVGTPRYVAGQSRHTCRLPTA